MLKRAQLAETPDGLTRGLAVMRFRPRQGPGGVFAIESADVWVEPRRPLGSHNRALARHVVEMGTLQALPQIRAVKIERLRRRRVAGIDAARPQPLPSPILEAAEVW